jgi:hypothetical protein
MPANLDSLWTLQASDPVQPRLLDAVTSLDEALLRMYRQAPTGRVGRGLRREVVAMLEGNVPYTAVYQMTRMAGIALWEREHERLAESIGI